MKLVFYSITTGESVKVGVIEYKNGKFLTEGVGDSIVDDTFTPVHGGDPVSKKDGQKFMDVIALRFSLMTYLFAVDET